MAQNLALVQGYIIGVCQYCVGCGPKPMTQKSGKSTALCTERQMNLLRHRCWVSMGHPQQQGCVKVTIFWCTSVGQVGCAEKMHCGITAVVLNECTSARATCGRTGEVRT